MEFDYSKLLGRITEKAGTQAVFALKMNLSERSVSRKLNNKLTFRQDEIVKACEALDIQPDEIADYFFREKVQSA